MSELLEGEKGEKGEFNSPQLSPQLSPERVEDPIITINQGRASSPYFWIIKPVPGIELLVGGEIRCINPRTKQAIDAIVTKHFWTFKWNDPPTGMLLGIYGVDPKLLRTVLMGTDTGFADDWARLVLVREK